MRVSGLIATSICGGFVILTACTAAKPQPTNFEPFLPPALNADWSRSAPVSGLADKAQFKTGVSSYADYRNTKRD